MNKKLFVTTSWDDGHVLDMRIAELLAKHGIGGTLYVTLYPSWPHLSPAQVRQLAAAFEIGAHTMHHHELPTLSDAQARAEIVDSKHGIEDILGRECTAFCFPRGKFNASHVRCVQEAGFKFGRTVEVMSFDLPRRAGGTLLMPTTVQAFPHKPMDYLRNFTKRFAVTNFRNYLSAERGRGWIALFESLLQAAIQRGGVFHFWGHSWEVEQTGQWEQLDRALGIMAGLGSQATHLNNSEVATLAGQAR